MTREVFRSAPRVRMDRDTASLDMVSCRGADNIGDSATKALGRILVTAIPRRNAKSWNCEIQGGVLHASYKFSNTAYFDMFVPALTSNTLGCQMLIAYCPF